MTAVIQRHGDNHDMLLIYNVNSRLFLYLRPRRITLFYIYGHRKVTFFNQMSVITSLRDYLKFIL